MSEEQRHLKVFLCYAHDDKNVVRELYRCLIDDGVDVWLDKANLLPGQDWELEIRKAVREVDVVVVCLTRQFNQAGFRQREVRLALETAMEQPEGEIFIIPARLQECDAPESLRKWHWVDLFEEDGYEMLMRALKTRANRIGATLQTKRNWLPKVIAPAQNEKKASKSIAIKHDKNKAAPSPGAQKTKEKYKPKTAIIVALIGFAGTIIAALISSPALVSWLERTPTLTVDAELRGTTDALQIELQKQQLTSSASSFGATELALTAQPAPTTVTVTLVPTETTETTEPTLGLTPVSGDKPILAETPFGGSEQIAFASSRSGIPQLYFIKVDGADPVQLTNMEQGACQPAWSPDGQQLVFISPCPGRGEFYETLYNESSLYLINADGTGLKQLTTASGDFDPAWSPDGTQIAFTSVRNGFRQIYSLDINSLAVTLLTNTTNSVECSQPAWSPDGTRIAYTVKRVGTYQVWAMTDTGQEAVQLARSGQNLWDFSPFWSTDGKTIFFSQRSHGPSRPWVMSVNFEDLSQDPKRWDFPTPIEDVSLSPDGMWLVFESMKNDNNRDIYFIRITGEERVRLTDDSKIDFDPAWRPNQY